MGWYSETETLGIYKQKSICFFYFYLWLPWVFVVVQGLSLVAGAPHRGGFFLLQNLGSRRVGFGSCSPRGLEYRFSSCGVQAFFLLQACGIFLTAGWTHVPCIGRLDSYPLCHQGSPHLLFVLQKTVIFFSSGDLIVMHWKPMKSICSPE